MPKREVQHREEPFFLGWVVLILSLAGVGIGLFYILVSPILQVVALIVSIAVPANVGYHAPKAKKASDIGKGIAVVWLVLIFFLIILMWVARLGDAVFHGTVGLIELFLD